MTVLFPSQGGLATVYLVFVMELATRRVCFAGTTIHPDEPFMKQVVGNLTDADGFLLGKTHVPMDRDTKFSHAVQDILQQAGVQPDRLPPRSPNLNAHLERFMRSIKEECLSRLVFFGEASLRKAVREYLEDYHAERNHQGLDNRLIDPGSEVGAAEGKILRHQRLGGMLNYYHRAA